MIAGGAALLSERRGDARRRGFTLVEITVALAILGLVAATLYLAFDGALRNAERVREAQEPYQRGRVARTFLASALRSATPFSGLANDKFVAVDTTFGAMPRDEITFVARSPEAGGRMQVHLYVADTDSGPALQVGVRPFVSEGDSLPDYETTTLTTGVAGLQIEYLAAPASAAAAWLERWDTAVRLPYAIRIWFMQPEENPASARFARGSRQTDPVYRTPLVVQIPAGRIL